jgi:uncharacterized alpha-E superfamily protein
MLSRVADCLYWLSRYLERAEHTARLVDVTLHLMLDQSPASAGPRWYRLQACLAPAPPDASGADASGRARAIAFDLLNRATFAACLESARENARAVASCLAAARENARAVRERISPRMWEQLNRLYLEVRAQPLDDSWLGQPHDYFRGIDQGAQLFHGITESTMCRDEGWHFLQLGKFVERAMLVAALLDVQCGALLDDGARPLPAADEHLEWLGLLRSTGGFEAYCRVHTAELRPAWIVQFLLLDAEFPHSLRFAVDRLGESLGAIAAATGRRHGRADRHCGKLRASLSFAQIDEVMASGLHEFLVEAQDVVARIQAAVHQTYVEPTVEALPTP